MSNSANNSIPFVPENTIDPASGLNEAINTIDSLLQLTVLTVGGNAPPSSPAEGDRHIVGTAPSGAWAGKAGQVARFLDGFWSFYSAHWALNSADGHVYVRAASTWSLMEGVSSLIVKDEGASLGKPSALNFVGAGVAVTSNGDGTLTVTIGGGGGGGAVSSVAGRTGDVVLVKADVGLPAVDNTPDSAKPVSGPQATALGLKVDKVTGMGLSQENFTTGEKSKLSAIATGATANDTDANLKNRSNHTGTQLAETISDFAVTVRATVLTGLSLASSAAVVAADTILAAIGKLQAQVSLKFDKAGGALTGPVTTSSAITSTAASTFDSLTLTSTGGTLVSGGELHTPVGLGAALSLARNGNMVSEFIVSTDSAGLCARFNLLKSAGTNAAPTVVTDATQIGVFNFIGYTGTAYISAANMSCAVDGTPTTAGVPGALSFSTVNAALAVAVRWRVRASGNFEPGADNAYSIGSSGARPSVIWAATGTISTSDAREKTPVATLTPNEVGAAKALAKEIGTYKWLSVIREKGEDARGHVGLTVQRAIEVMESFELAPFDYGFICYDEWDERVIPDQSDEGGPGTIVPAGNRYSFRFDELNLFLAAGFEARLAAIEAAQA